jgi:membrane protein YdbS with pleckstrin-like domain
MAEAPYKFMKDWSAREWFLGIVSFVLFVAFMVMVDEYLHIRKPWFWAIQLCLMFVFVYIIGQINEHKKIREKKNFRSPLP